MKQFMLSLLILGFGIMSAVMAQAPTVARSIITTGISEREPVGQVDSVSADAGKVFFFTELKNMTGQKITHRWVLGGKVVAEVPFSVKGPRWRVHSSKNLSAEWTGEWKVEVVDSSNNVIGAASFVCLAGAASMRPITTNLSESVKRAIFTTNMVDREPENQVDTLSTTVNKIFFFTELIGLKDRQVKHRWIYAGDVKAELSFDVKANRWRVHSSKNLVAGWKGTWQVEIVVDDSTVVGSHGFIYQ